ncbi:hypothetical protein [Streptomyces sp. NBC_01334]|uniref:hypothetical protein n=1 Tax=Streptomyces sp. NBC_01334 TaxID=2903827 RepID=UPI002E0DCCF5|nr:hypothetical protein OG736_23575 [Streptomyces sp. NBC_01334]
MGLLISTVLLALLQWGLRLMQLGGAALCLLGVALFLRRFRVARRREASGGLRQAMPWATHVLGGIGIFMLVAASGALTVGERLGVFGT